MKGRLRSPVAKTIALIELCVALHNPAAKPCQDELSSIEIQLDVGYDINVSLCSQARPAALSKKTMYVLPLCRFHLKQTQQAYNLETTSSWDGARIAPPISFFDTRVCLQSAPIYVVKRSCNDH